MIIKKALAQLIIFSLLLPNFTWAVDPNDSDKESNVYSQDDLDNEQEAKVVQESKVIEENVVPAKAVSPVAAKTDPNAVQKLPKFHVPMPKFEDTEEGKRYIKENGGLPAVRTSWNSPPPKTIYDALEKKASEARVKKIQADYKKKLDAAKKKAQELIKKKKAIQSKKTTYFKKVIDLIFPSAHADDQEGITRPGEVNCRDSTSETGYFRAVFEEYGITPPPANPVGFAHPTFGAQRRAAMCQVLKELAALLNLTNTNARPDIIFPATNPSDMPSNALAAASTFYGVDRVVTGSATDNGTLHYHIVARQDPTPALNKFDALVYINWVMDAPYSWSVDSSLNSLTYDFKSVMRHEILHALGFLSRLEKNNQNNNRNGMHNTFNLFSYSGTPSANNRYVNPSNYSYLVQVPNGDPSSWYINNNNYYQGILNSPNASFDGARPLYSPIGWQGGSSISHFDDLRANNITVAAGASPCNSYPLPMSYTMNPFICRGIENSIHQHEKEVLCHLGYQVDGLCDDPSPWANDDVQIINGSSMCLPLVTNDYSFTGPAGLTLSLHDASVITPLNGATISYFSSENGCTGPLPGPSGARSIKIQNYSTPIGLRYQVIDQNSNRISNVAAVSISHCPAGLNEMICNGDFELGIRPGYVFVPYYKADSIMSSYNQGINFRNSASAFWKAAYVSPNHLVSPDFVMKNYPGLTVNGPAHLPFTTSVNNSFLVTYDLIGASKFAIHFASWERITTKLKAPLIPGETYKVSFDISNRKGMDSTTAFTYDIGLALTSMDQDDPNAITISNATTVATQSIPAGNTGVIPWNHFEQTFIADAPYEYFLINLSGPDAIYGSSHYIDNVSLIRVNPSQLSASNTTSINCSNASINATVQGGYPPYTYSWTGPNNFTASTEDISNLTVSGTYVLTVTDLNGDTASTYANITAPAAVSISGTVASTATNVSINTTTTGATPTSYSWTGPAGSNYSSTQQNASGISVSGTYTVTATYGNNCTAQASIVVQPSCATAPPSSNFNTTLTSSNNVPLFQCYLHTTATGGSECLYNIANPAGVNPNGWNTGCPSTVAGTNCCNWKKACGGVVAGEPVTTISGTVTNATSGSNGSIALTVAGIAPLTYLWSNGATTQNLSNLAAGTYSVTVKNANGCATSSSFTLHSQMSVNASKTQGCAQASNTMTATVSGGASPYTYRWYKMNGTTPVLQTQYTLLNSPNLTQTITGMAAGIYNVVITDNNGQQQSSQNLTIDAYTAPTIAATKTNATATAYNNGTIKTTVTGGVAPFNYYFTGLYATSTGPISTNPYTRTGLSGNNDAQATYGVFVIDSKNCQSNTVSGIKVLNTLTATTKAVVDCSSGTNQIRLMAVPAGGHNGFIYEWKQGTSVVATTESFLATPGAVYTLQVKDNSTPQQLSPVYTVTAPSTVPALHTVAVTIANATNSQSNGVATVTATAGLGPYTFTYTPPGTVLSGVSSNINTRGNLAPGAYSVGVKTNYGCNVNKSFTILNSVTSSDTIIKQ